MTSLRVFAIVATMGALLLGISACVRGLPEVEEYCDELDCNALLHCCDDVRCHWCCEDRDCERGENCDENYECVPREGAPPGVPPGSQPVDGECYTDTECLSKLHCCDDYGCQKCCYDMHCDQGENCEYYQCVPIEEPPEPELVGQVPAPEPEEEAQPTPAPETEPECTVDAVVTFVVSGEPGQEFWAARWQEEGPPRTWLEMKQRFCEDGVADLHTWDLIAATADGDGKATITIPGNSWWTVLGRSLGDASGLCAIVASDWYEVTEQMQCLGAQIDVPGVQPVFWCIEDCSKLQ